MFDTFKGLFLRGTSQVSSAESQPQHMLEQDHFKSQFLGTGAFGDIKTETTSILSPMRTTIR